MRTLWTTVGAAIAAFAVTAAVAAAADGDVDRERLQRLAVIPHVGERYVWNFVLAQDGRFREGGQIPTELDPAALRQTLGDDDADAEGWLDLAAAYRSRRDEEAAKESLARAIAILRRRAAAQSDDGRASTARTVLSAIGR